MNIEICTLSIDNFIDIFTKQDTNLLVKDFTLKMTRVSDFYTYTFIRLIFMTYLSIEKVKDKVKSTLQIISTNFKNNAIKEKESFTSTLTTIERYFSKVNFLLQFIIGSFKWKSKS